MTNPSRTRAQQARLHLARIRQSLTGCYWRTRTPPPDPLPASRRAELAAIIEQAQATPQDPPEAERLERLMALLRGERS